MNRDNGKLHGGTADSPEINTTSLSTACGEDSDHGDYVVSRRKQSLGKRALGLVGGSRMRVRPLCPSVKPPSRGHCPGRKVCPSVYPRRFLPPPTSSYKFYHFPLCSWTSKEYR